METTKNSTVRFAVIGIVVVLIILVGGTLWTGRSTSQDTEEAVHSVSLLYLNELAGRREQVIAANLSANIRNLNVAIELMTQDDLSDIEHLQSYQSRMKQLYDLEKFAFVDTDGLIYTSTGTQNNIADYGFDHLGLAGPSISVLNGAGKDHKVS